MGAASCPRPARCVLIPGLFQLRAGPGVSDKCHQAARLTKGDEEDDNKEAEVDFPTGNQVRAEKVARLDGTPNGREPSIDKLLQPAAAPTLGPEHK